MICASCRTARASVCCEPRTVFCSNHRSRDETGYDCASMRLDTAVALHVHGQEATIGFHASSPETALIAARDSMLGAIGVSGAPAGGAGDVGAQAGIGAIRGRIEL